MRLLVFLVLVALAPSTAFADAIMPFEGECPPGTRRGISGHAESCIPIVCTSDAQCGSDAECVTLCICMAPRPDYGSGRVEVVDPPIVDTEIGFCTPAGGCAEGRADERRQCEPESSTPAFANHRWTGESHSNSGCHAAPDAGHASPAAGFALVLLLLATRRRALRD